MKKLLSKMLFALIIILMGITVFTIPKSEVFACSCSGVASVDSAFVHSEFVFYGKVISLENRSGGVSPNPEIERRARYNVATVKVFKSWKGNPDSLIKIVATKGGGDCGYPFEVNNYYLVFAWGQDTLLATNVCTPTCEGNKARTIYGYLCTKYGGISKK